MNWEEKEDKVYFRGALGENVYMENGERNNRWKLMDMAAQNPDDIWFGYILHLNLKHEDYSEPPPLKFNVSRKDMCEVNNYKYMITLDGHASSW